MLAIRMQRTGRKGHAQFRLIVQDKRFSPKSGRLVALLGSYDPHSKKATVDKEKATTYLSNGAQPTEKVANLLKAEGVKLPAWVQQPQKQKKSVKHPEKLRRNRPADTAEPKQEPATSDEAPVEPVPQTPEVVEDTQEKTEAEVASDGPAEQKAPDPAMGPTDTELPESAGTSKKLAEE